MRKKILALLFVALLLISGSAYIPSQEAQAAWTSSADTKHEIGGFRADPRQLASDSQGSGLQSQKLTVGAASTSASLGTYWSQFSGSVYYDQMNSSQKSFYNKLKAIATEYLVGNTDVSAKRFSDGTYAYVTEAVTQSGITLSEAVNITTLFLYENPQFYFINSAYIPYTENYTTGFSSSSYSWSVCMQVYSAYASGSTRATYTQQFKSVVDSYLSGANAYGSDLAKETYFHDRLASTVSYNDAAASNYQTEEVSQSQSAASAFLRNHTVCAGYTKAMSLLLNAEKITNVGVTSHTHAWNEVMIDGTWYILDVTWDQNSWPSYAYFNISESELRARDQWTYYYTSGTGYFGSSGYEWVHTPLSYYSSIRPIASTAHSLSVDPIDLNSPEALANKAGNMGSAGNTGEAGSSGNTGNTGNTGQAGNAGNTATTSTSESSSTSDSSSTTDEGGSPSIIAPQPQEIETEAPLKPSYFSVRRISRGTVRLSIKSSSSAYGYYVVYRQKGKTAWNSYFVEVDGRSAAFRIRGLSPGKTYQLKAYSVNEKGIRSAATKTRTIKA